ncbi:MAG: isoprenylcysteine carboxylmethyltransferase family protein [Anaerolineae bacterium]|nr:MAG: isoprenylcysteine carboxylmethyltransferase family protein [Anaerolineae bacterium]
MPAALTSPLSIFLAFGVYAVIHSLLASFAAKDLGETFFGKAGRKYYRLFFNIVGTLTLLPVLALPVLLPDTPLYTIPAPWSYLTAAVQLAAALLLLYSVIQTGALDFLGLSQAAGIKTNDTLNTSGLYRFMRHPLYTFSMLFLWLTPVMTANLAALYLAISVYFYVGALFEERKLVRIFGQQYIDYRAHTPMLLPRLWGGG